LIGVDVSNVRSALAGVVPQKQAAAMDRIRLRLRVKLDSFFHRRMYAFSGC
jgi:hypothetical protein